MIWNQKETCFAEQIEGLVRRGKSKQLSRSDFEILFDFDTPIPYEELASTVKYINYNISSIELSGLYCDNIQNNKTIIRHNNCELGISTDGYVYFNINRFDDRIVMPKDPVYSLMFRYINHNQPYMELTYFNKNTEELKTLRGLGKTKRFNNLCAQNRRLFQITQNTMKEFFIEILYNIYLMEVKNDG